MLLKPTIIVVTIKLKDNAIITKNKRNTKNAKLIPYGNLLCDAGLTIHKDGNQYLKCFIKQKFYCEFAVSKDD